MPVRLGTSVINRIFLRQDLEATVSSSVIGLLSSSYSNGSSWPSTTGSNVSVVNSPLISGSNGRWQFNGTDDYLNITQSTLNATFDTSNSTIAQPFTFLFYGTIGSLSTRRAFFGAGGSGYAFGGDAILRTDTSPGSGRIHLDLRTVGGTTNRFNIAGSSGSILNLAVVQDNNASQSVYQNGVLLATSGALAGGYAPWRSNNGSDGAYIGFNGDTDADNYNGQLGATFLYNRALSATEISQSSLFFLNGFAAVTASVAYLGSNLVFSQSAVPAPPTSMSVTTLVVAGGGGGGVGTGGGGGAGGVVYSASLSLPVGTYAANVGSGGAGGPATTTAAATIRGYNGQASSFISGSIIVSASGGGGGASYGNGDASGGTGSFAGSGGSGGGESDVDASTSGSGLAGQGNKGGAAALVGAGCGGGGGGASQAGQPANTAYPNGNGGAGGSGSAYTIRSGTSVFYGGGGGGGNYAQSNLAGLGGPGGGGNGSKTGGGGNATSNTGGGGGGSYRSLNGLINSVGGNGGSGIIVISYLTSSAAGLTVSGGIEQTYDSGSLTYKSHTFLSSSNLVIN